MRGHFVGPLALAAVILLAAMPAPAQQRGTNARPQSIRGDVNSAGPDGVTPLHTAVQAGDRARVRSLIRAGANVNAVTRYGSRTPLALAAVNGDADMIGVLLNAGADPNAKNAEGETVLMTAARTGNPAAVQALIRAGASVNAREEWFQQTPLIWAAAQNHAAAMKVLIEAGADLNARASVPSRNQSDGGDGGQMTTRNTTGGMTPLLYAARNGGIDAIRTLADAGADLNLPDPNGICALVYALINGHYDAAALLLEQGADPNVVDKTGRGPLFVAVDMHTLEYRLNRPDPKLDNRLTSVDLVKMLLDHGARVDQKLTANIISPGNNAAGNQNLTAGSTPFLKAATTSDVELMRLLLARGADPKVTNREGTNALMMAAGVRWRVLRSRGAQENAIEAVKMLMDLGLDINAANSTGDTALHGAASRTTDLDSNKLIEFLVANGANLYAKNKSGRTPLDESEGEELTANKGGADKRGLNARSRALLLELMQKNPQQPVAAP